MAKCLGMALLNESTVESSQFFSSNFLLNVTERSKVSNKSITGVCTCGQWPGADRIVGGAVAKPHSLPYQVTRQLNISPIMERYSISKMTIFNPTGCDSLPI